MIKPTAYDNFEKLTCTTQIAEVKNGYYAFNETVFYGEKGGQLADHGTINGLPVIDLKWDHGTLYHKVDGDLHNPIHMQVDAQTRWINTTVQSAFHLLDGYYAHQPMKIIEVHANPDSEWYIVDSKQVTTQQLADVEQWMNDVIHQDIQTSFSYVKGSEYPDKADQKYPVVRLVHFGNINTQPCGTCHVNHTSQLQSFAIIGTAKVSTGTKIYITVNQVTTDRLKKDEQVLNDVTNKLSVNRDQILPGISDLQAKNKQLKKQLKAYRQQLAKITIQQIIMKNQAVNYININNAGDLSVLAPQLLRQIKETKLILAQFENKTYFAIVSPQNVAHDVLAKFHQAGEIRGGGSAQIVTGNTSVSGEQLSDLFKTIL